MWQNGPDFLWQKKLAKEVAAIAKEGIDQLQRKYFTAALTRAQVKKQSGIPSFTAMPKSLVSIQVMSDQEDAQQSGPDGK